MQGCRGVLHLPQPMCKMIHFQPQIGSKILFFGGGGWKKVHFAVSHTPQDRIILLTGMLTSYIDGL